jgi:hypothetical protein
MTPQENETWAEVTWKPGHGPDDTAATDEQIREWALACQAEFRKDHPEAHSYYAALWAHPGLRLRTVERLATHGYPRAAAFLRRVFRLPL